MEIRRLGSSGMKVTSICLGTMAFGRWIDEPASARVIDAAFDAGINFFDTADMYGKGMDTGSLTDRGTSEEILGRLLGPRRSRILLATKVFNRMGPGPNEAGLSRLHIMNAAEASLRRLRTDWVDLYQCHRFDPQTSVEETLRAFDDLIRQGKVRYVGVSNWAAWQMAKAHGVADRLGLPRFVSNQPLYNLLDREIEQELVPFCLSEGVGIIPYSPLSRGLLTGKYRPGEAPPEGTRGAAGESRLQSLMTPENFTRVERFRSLCREWNRSMAGAATAWVLANPAVVSAIVGASRPEHVTDAVAAAAVRLTPEQKQELDALF
jgi:1-deoxyxylulose-5-phosphate synthase